jgi:endonuclease/exonuclease/phosphatase family metal-dependent hydrolase
MVDKFRAMTWNIGGAYIRRPKSALFDHYDYAYFVEKVCQIRPDILCLQEIQDGYGQIDILQRRTGYFALSIPISQSHFDSNSQLMLSILSRWKLSRAHYSKLPNPDISAIDDDGLFISSFDNGFLSGTIDELGIRVHCGHCLPFHRFHRDIMENEFSEIRGAICETIQPQRESTIVCADFNITRLAQAIPSVVPRAMRDCLPGCATTPSGMKLDYILATHDLGTIQSGVHNQVLSDHFPAVADMRLS